jgi:threonine/homoserine/homoserine lactone efflux protein
VSFIVSIPIGAVNMAVFQATLNHNRWAGYAIGFGAILAEMIYCGLPLFGLGMMNENAGFFDLMYLLFIPILVFLGVFSIINRKKGVKVKEAGSTGKNQPAPPGRKSYFAYIVYGFLLCFSNPMTLVFWSQATITMQKMELVTQEIPVLVAFFIGVPIGTWSLYAAFVFMAIKTRKKINPLWKERLNIMIGVIFIVLAFYLLFTYLHNHNYI